MFIFCGDDPNGTKNKLGHTLHRFKGVIFRDDDPNCSSYEPGHIPERFKDVIRRGDGSIMGRCTAALCLYGFHRRLITCALNTIPFASHLEIITDALSQCSKLQVIDQE